MNKKIARLSRMLPVLLALTVSACSGGGQPAATATPVPQPTPQSNASATTAPAKPTATTPPAEPTATTPPAEPTATTPPATETATEASLSATGVPTTTATNSAPIKLSSQPFTHKSGAFTITLPEGWKVAEDDNGVSVSSPDGQATIDVSFTNVGAKFDAGALDRYIKAAEANRFGGFKNYKGGLSEAPLSTGAILVIKSLELSDGTPQVVFSWYLQDRNVIYEQDIWFHAGADQQYIEGMTSVIFSMKTNAAAGSKAKAYASVYKFVDPNKRFEFTVPFGWVHEIIPETHGAIDSFYTPDGLSFINNITHDDGTTLSKSDAHSTALALTKSFYKITDLKVTGDKPQSEGSERLTWNSASQGIMGETIFVTRGTTFLVLIWVVDNAHYDTFKPVWASVAASYQVPQP